MSTTNPTPSPALSTRKKVTTRTFRQKKQRGELITMLTAYDTMPAQAVSYTHLGLPAGDFEIVHEQRMAGRATANLTRRVSNLEYLQIQVLSAIIQRSPGSSGTGMALSTYHKQTLLVCRKRILFAVVSDST